MALSKKIIKDYYCDGLPKTEWVGKRNEVKELKYIGKVAVAQKKERKKKKTIRYRYA